MQLVAFYSDRVTDGLARVFGAQKVYGEQIPENETMPQTRVNFLGARGIEAVIAIDHTRGNQVSLRWLLYDGHGNLVRTLSPDYTLSAFQWRGVWGEVQSSLGTGRGYCANLGHPEDETGLVYMRARYYEPATGRFLSEDPARDGVNWYLYADGNPVSYADYSGEHPVLIALALGAVLAFFESLISQLILNRSIDGWQLLIDTLVGGIAGAVGVSIFAALKGVKWASRLGFIRATFEFLATMSSAKEFGIALGAAMLAGTLMGGLRAAITGAIGVVRDVIFSSLGYQVQLMLYMASIELESE